MQVVLGVISLSDRYRRAGTLNGNRVNSQTTVLAFSRETSSSISSNCQRCRMASASSRRAGVWAERRTRSNSATHWLTSILGLSSLMVAWRCTLPRPERPPSVALKSIRKTTDFYLRVWLGTTPHAKREMPMATIRSRWMKSFRSRWMKSFRP